MVRIPRSCRLRCWASGTFPLEIGPLEIGISVGSGYHIASLQQSIRNVQECRMTRGGIVVRACAPRTTRYAHGCASPSAKIPCDAVAECELLLICSTKIHRRSNLVPGGPSVAGWGGAGRCCG